MRAAHQSNSPFVGFSYCARGSGHDPFRTTRVSAYQVSDSKDVFLMAITSLKRIGDLQALSISPSCLDFAPGLVKVILHPHPNYLPKVPFSTMNPVVLEAFCPLPFTTPEQERLHLLCPVRALQIYVHRTSQWRKSEQLFICYGAATGLYRIG